MDLVVTCDIFISAAVTMIQKPFNPLFETKFETEQISVIKAPEKF